RSAVQSTYLSYLSAWCTAGRTGPAEAQAQAQAQAYQVCKWCNGSTYYDTYVRCLDGSSKVPRHVVVPASELPVGVLCPIVPAFSPSCGPSARSVVSPAKWVPPALVYTSLTRQPARDPSPPPLGPPKETAAEITSLRQVIQYAARVSAGGNVSLTLVLLFVLLFVSVSGTGEHGVPSPSSSLAGTLAQP
ncbi:hypothetical protein GQ607_010267, partial [Colletotrichum asianum]